MTKLVRIIMVATTSLLMWASGIASAAEPETVTVKVGGALTLTGPGAFWHLAGGKAQIAFFKHLNKQGGVPYTGPDGKQRRFLVDFKYEDTVYDAKKVAIAFSRLKDWGAHIITEDGSTPAAALVAPSARDKVPVVSVWTVHPDPDHYLEDIGSQYLLPNMPTNVDTTNGLLYLYKKHVWDKKRPGEALKAGVIAFDNPPRRLYKERWVKEFYAKSGIDLVGVAIVPLAVTDVSVELKRLHEAGARVVLVDHIVSGAKVVLENAERLGIRKDLDFIAWYYMLPQFLEAPQLFDGIYNPWPTPQYFTERRTPQQEAVAKIYLDDDPEYWTERVDWALATHQVLQYTMDAVKVVLEKYGFAGLTRERIRNELFSARTVDTGIHPRFTVDPKAPLTLPYLYLYRLDAKNKRYVELGKPAAAGPSPFQPRWNASDDPAVVETRYYQ